MRTAQFYGQSTGNQTWPELLGFDYADYGQQKSATGDSFAGERISFRVVIRPGSDCSTSQKLTSGLRHRQSAVFFGVATQKIVDADVQLAEKLDDMFCPEPAAPAKENAVISEKFV